MAERAISKTSAKLVRGDTWTFGPYQKLSAGSVPTDLTGCTIFAAVKWPGGAIAIDTEIGDTEQATGFYWIDQAQGEFAFRVKGRSTKTATDSDNEDVPANGASFVYRIFDSLGELQTDFIKPIEVTII